MKDQMKQVFLRCDCGYLGHVMEVSYDIDQHHPAEHSYFLLSMQMDTGLSFFERLWVSLKYLFKPHYFCGFGGWASVSLKKDGMNQIRELMQEYEEGLNQATQNKE